MSCFFERRESDFPEFDKKYLEVLLPENPDVLDKLAAYTNFDIFHHDLWNGTGRRFARAIIEECIDVMKQQESLPTGTLYAKTVTIHEQVIKQHFGITDE